MKICSIKLFESTTCRHTLSMYKHVSLSMCASLSHDPAFLIYWQPKTHLGEWEWIQTSWFARGCAAQWAYLWLCLSLNLQYFPSIFFSLRKNMPVWIRKMVRSHRSLNVVNTLHYSHCSVIISHDNTLKCTPHILNTQKWKSTMCKKLMLCEIKIHRNCSHSECIYRMHYWHMNIIQTHSHTNVAIEWSLVNLHTQTSHHMH